MMRFERVPKPPGFKEVEDSGRAWLDAPVDNRAKQRPSLWVRYSEKLAEGFRHLCGYSAVYVANGQVDHFVSEKEDPRRLYDWDNYRYADGWLNASKKDLRSDQLLDPFDVEDGWFEIILPSLQLVVTEACPADRRERAERMLTRLRLSHDERVVRYRREWYRMYQDGELTLEGLAKKAPLIARAVAKQRGAT
jgi:hypothetical protein